VLFVDAMRAGREPGHDKGPDVGGLFVKDDKQMRCVTTKPCASSGEWHNVIRDDDHEIDIGNSAGRILAGRMVGGFDDVPFVAESAHDFVSPRSAAHDTDPSSLRSRFGLERRLNPREKISKLSRCHVPLPGERAKCGQ
jgi:hypothetical protein